MPGDTPVQKRFFDVMMHGCIPIMPTWPSNLPNQTTNWRPGMSALSQTFPFAPLHFHNDSQAGIDYINDVIVTFDGECGGPCARESMERVMGNLTELQRLRANVKKYAPLFAYGIQHNSYRNLDAFAAIVVNLRHQAATNLP
uniref:Exostosin GT47 domain-containing protein n=1 Tax=Cyclophora tenuis TaxID=216820 RepID=A0A7S1D6X7_CYCTE